MSTYPAYTGTKKMLKKSKTEMTASVQENKLKHRRGSIRTRFVIGTRQNKCAHFRHYVAFNKATNDTDILKNTKAVQTELNVSKSC